MARIIYSALVESIRGSIAGTTFQRNAYGFTIKSKPNMVNPNSIRQITASTHFQAISQAWRQLDQADRDAWIAWAVTLPVPARLNPASNLNGFNVFQRYHAFRWITAAGVILADPTGSIESVTDVQSELYRVGATLIFEPNTTITGASWIVLAYFTGTLGAGQSFIHQTPVFIQSPPAPDGVATDITVLWNLKYGVLPPTGSRIGVKLAFVRSTVGQVIVIPPFILEVG